LYVEPKHPLADALLVWVAWLMLHPMNPLPLHTHGIARFALLLQVLGSTSHNSAQCNVSDATPAPATGKSMNSRQYTLSRCTACNC
jgi:hypothetical protein